MRMGKFGSYQVYLALMVLVGSFACQDTEDASMHGLSHVKDKKARRVLSRALEYAGGVEAYQSIRKLRYVKRSVLYHSDGTTESDVSQLHEYTLQPEVSGRIGWRDSTGVHMIVYSPDQAYKAHNGSKVPNSAESAYRTFMSAYYVLFMPFKLMDEGATITYEGETTLDDDSEVDVIKAAYDSSPDDDRGTSDTWWYYFDTTTGAYKASMVYHAPTYALIENNEVSDPDPIIFNLYRKSYRVDSLRGREFLRGEFYYSDFVVN